MNTRSIVHITFYKKLFSTLKDKSYLWLFFHNLQDSRWILQLRDHRSRQRHCHPSNQRRPQQSSVVPRYPRPPRWHCHRWLGSSVHPECHWLRLQLLQLIFSPRSRCSSCFSQPGLSDHSTFHWIQQTRGQSPCCRRDPACLSCRGSRLGSLCSSHQEDWQPHLPRLQSSHCKMLCRSWWSRWEPCQGWLYIRGFRHRILVGEDWKLTCWWIGIREASLHQ